MIQGIDVSWCQGQIEWPRVAEAGIRFAICKMTEGAHGVDPTGIRNLEAARAVGLVEGAYHFARVADDPVMQADALWRAVGPMMPKLPPVIDIESAPSFMTGPQIIEATERLAKEIRDRFGRWPIIYSYPSFLMRLGPTLAKSGTLGMCKLWIAHYLWTKDGAPPISVQPMVPMPWSKWTIWQHSGNGGAKVPGIATDVDRNVFAGDERAFRELQGLEDAPETERELVFIPPDIEPRDPEV